MEKPDLDLEGLRLDPSLVGEAKACKEEAEVQTTFPQRPNSSRLACTDT